MGTTVEFSASDGVGWLHLNRPDRLNAVDTTLTDDLLAGLDQARAHGVRAVVLAGRGRAFCAGHDLKEPVPVETALQTRGRLERIQDVTRGIRALDAPVIAAVHGYALGAGCEFALACDIVVAAEDAEFGFPEVSVGLSVTGGVSRLLPVLVGWAKAKDLLLLGDRVDGVEAQRIGLVARTASPGHHEDVAAELAARIASRPALSTALAKRVLDRGLDASMESSLEREVEHAMLTAEAGAGETARQGFSGDER
ncbi:enoyl-CoA hydratase/isomerase family protein [Nocardioides sp. R-C-SC26]|uniref:enoyl-CoA hydratase/isomerase family protein n=1 Tax=Nocardioides sp. R-C-SC26 TaxID=2870414 RepID=UPI001E564E6E|nr:enoyl-CoA hydratase/isomerase family protein [Nocardioides sp. R-C-SC26]